jgi:hypothetical protein
MLSCRGLGQLYVLPLQLNRQWHASSVHCVKYMCFILEFVLKMRELLIFYFCCEVLLQWVILLWKHTIQILWYDCWTLLWLNVTAPWTFCRRPASCYRRTRRSRLWFCVSYSRSLHRGVRKAGCESRLLATSCLSICPHKNKVSRTRWIFVKFRIWEFCQKLSTNTDIC